MSRSVVSLLAVMCWSCTFTIPEPPGPDAGRPDAGPRPDNGPDVGPPADPLPDASVSATGVTVVGRRLYVDGEPYEIRGVCWSPIPRGARVPVDWSLDLADRDVPLMAAAGINTVRTYTPIDDEELLDALHEAGIRVVQDVFIAGGIEREVVLERVRRFRDHPAILMWSLGNEWNLNGFYAGISDEESEALIESVAADIQALDPDHPVATIHGDLPSRARIRAMPSIDVWGLNVYRGERFFGLIEDWAARSGKPMFISEYGVDAYDGRLDRTIEDEQASFITTQTEEWVATSAARFGSGVVLGATIFEWSDEWWKDETGSPDAHDTGSLGPGGFVPDRLAHEEWWGLVDIDRNPRPALEAYSAAIAE